MNAILENINSMGRAFVEFAVPMLLQSSVLILILLLVDLVLRGKVRAVFRYWIWMLVLAKLVLPTSLSSPVSLGRWFGEQLDYLNTKQRVLAAESANLPEPTPNFGAFQPADMPELADPLSTEASTQVPAPTPTAEPVRPVPADAPVASPDPATPVTWQAVVFLIWLAVVVTMGLLLLQRALFVRGLVAQAREANGLMKDAFEFCRKQIAVSGEVRLKVSPNATSPAVCGLFRPVILVPHNLASNLGSRDLRGVFLHELAHIKRGDLWVNLVQTVLQITYFYNPLLWLANAVIRRVREQAVDEAVLVAMGEKAAWYPQTLVNVARLAFKRPALSLRLIGVVESKSALAARIKRILNRPTPKSAKLGVIGLMLVFVTGAALLPMATAQEQPGDDTAVVLDSDKDGLENQLEQELGTNPRLSDTDGDGLSDYDEYCKYRTDPAKKDSDSDGKPDGDWQERREHTYTIRAICEIRPPSGLEIINDLYQDVRRIDRKASVEDAVVVEVLLFPFAAAHIYAQPYPRQSPDDSLKEYVQPTVSMNFSPEMQRQVADIVEGAATEVDAIEKMLRWMSGETELIKYNPHWDYFHVIDNQIVRHGSLGDAEQDKRFLETNFFADSMFKNKVHGTCSSTAILRGAMFRAAGLPTRLIQTLPLITRYSEDPEPLADKLRMRAMANGYDWGPGTGGANHMYNEVFLNNRWVRVDNSIGTGPFVSDKLFVKAWSSSSLNNIKEEWNNKRCFRALDVSDAYPKYKSEAAKPDIAIQNRDLTVKKLADGQYKATIIIHNNGQEPTPRLKVLFYAGDPDSGGRKVHPSYHRAGPIMPGATWGESTYPFSLKQDENELFVVVDPDNLVEESDETNNKASTEVSGAPKKVGNLDIAVEGFKITFRDQYNNYYVVASIRNKGRDISPQFPVYFYVGDPAVARPITHAAGPIKPGAVWDERSGNFGLRDGLNNISVAVDPDNAFAESDETNNRAWLSVVIENGRIVKQSVSYSPSEPQEGQIPPDRTDVEGPISTAARQRYFVRLVVGADRMTFEGQQVTWEDLSRLLEKVPHRSNTVLTLALASNDMTLAEKNQATGRAEALAKDFGFEYLSYIGVHPLGSRGEPAHAIFEGPLQFDKEIPIPLAAGTPEEPDLVECKWIRFEKSAGQVQAILHTKCFRLRAKWEVRVRLLNTKDTELSYATATLKSGAEPAGAADFSEVELLFSLGKWSEALEAARYEVRIRQLPDTTETPASRSGEAGVAVQRKSENEAAQQSQIKTAARKIVSSTGKKSKSIEEFIAPFASGTKLAVTGINGSIKVSAGKEPECRIKAAIEVETKSKQETKELMDKVKVDVRQLAENLSVEVQQPKLRKKQSVTVDFEITLPPQANLDLRTNNGSIDIADISGDIESRTNNGSLSAVRTAGNTRLHTNNGHINVTKAALAPGTINANNGSITCKEISGDLQAELNNGRVKISYAKTSPGVCSVSVNANNADIDFTGPLNFSAVVDAVTHTGSIRTDLPLTVKGWMGKTASGTLGKGEGKLRLETSNGSIRIATLD
ncbi:MAG TPA: M56 family metallopeptidase [Sedimentisphaerales bacterium]|nr:M56 family metallopeptidase [Sedimentisphaerales bacterium]